MINLGERIKSLRAAKGLTQSELALRVGVSKAAISAYEIGSRLPSYDILIKLTHIFGTTTDDLLGRSNQQALDITGLTSRQRHSVQELISTYKKYNALLYDKLKEDDSIEDELIRLGLTDEFTGDLKL